MIFKTFITVIASFGLSKFAASETIIGVPSYWGVNGDYDAIPDGSLAVINPVSGIIDYTQDTLEIASTASDFGLIIDALQARNVKVQGYVPTGYFNHDCDQMGECQTWERIVTQIHVYFELYPDLDGIFFDEAAASGKDCADYAEEYSILRGFVRRYSEDASISFNPGMSDPCVISASGPNEIILNFEGDLNKFEKAQAELRAANLQAEARGVKTWHLVYDVPDAETAERLANASRLSGAALFYATEIGGDWRAGENTWGSPAKHLASQVGSLEQQPEQSTR